MRTTQIGAHGPKCAVLRPRWAVRDHLVCAPRRGLRLSMKTSGPIHLSA